MKKLKYYLKDILGILLFQIVLMIPILNLYLTAKSMKQTIELWACHKKPLWLYSGEVVIQICNGNENITIFNGKLNDLTFAETKEAKIIRTTEVKYIDIDENKLKIRLWNEKKINKFYKIENEY